MGKKGSWLSALKKAFTSTSREKPVDISERKYVKEKKKWGLGRSKHGETNSFIPIYREPSSIEKILGDADREQHQKIHQSSASEKFTGAERVRKEKTHQPSSAQRVQNQSIQQVPSQNPQQLKLAPPLKSNVIRNNASKATIPKKNPLEQSITKNYAQVSAIKIQAAYRGYIARKSYRTLKGLMRLQRAMRGQSVKRQTMNTMRCMQLFVRVQSQIRSRRLQMTETRSFQQHQTPKNSDKEIESSLGKWNLAHQSEVGSHENWDDSVLAKQEIDERMQRKVEAVIKRERALAYAYSHQLLKVTPKSAHAVLADLKSGGFPWWWNWLERQLPHVSADDHSTSRPKPGTIATPKNASSNAHLHPTSHSMQSKANFSHFDTPRSTKPFQSSNRWHATTPRDDESLTSCPVFTVPNYMAPTVSAKAKVRDTTTSHEVKKRFSFALTQGIGPLKWNKGSSQMGKDSASQRTTGRHRSLHSLGSLNLSVDSTLSLPVGVGRKQFK